MDNITIAVTTAIEDATGLAMSSISLTSQLSPDLGLDSIELVQLGQDLEEALGIEIPDSVVNANTTVGELIEGIRQLK